MLRPLGFLQTAIAWSCGMHVYLEPKYSPNISSTKTSARLFVSWTTMGSGPYVSNARISLAVTYWKLTVVWLQKQLRPPTQSRCRRSITRTSAEEGRICSGRSPDEGRAGIRLRWKQCSKRLHRWGRVSKPWTRDWRSLSSRTNSCSLTITLL